jgi:type IV secretion system protein VirD4
MKFWNAGTQPATKASSRAEKSATKGIYFGRCYDDESKSAGYKIQHMGERHLLVFGPNGSGKGTRFIVPNLLCGLEDRSVIAIDPKGELAAITADHRRKMGHEVVILNPFNVLGLGSAGFNPLAKLDPTSPNFYDDAAGIGEALVKIEGNEPHWPQSAQGLVVGLVMWEKLTKGVNANLDNVRAMLTEPNEWEIVTGSDGKPVKRQSAGLRVTARKMINSGGSTIESLASRFTQEESRELAGIQSAADTQTRWMLSDPMRDDLKKDGIDFSKLKDKPTTVYVILPAERLRTHSVWLRLVIVSALRSLYKPGGLRTLMLIDEMAALDHLAPLEDAFGLVRGYRVQIAAIFQDLPQLKSIYQKRWETFVANAGAIMGLTPNDMETAGWMSQRSGQTTALAKSFSANTGTTSGKEASLSIGSGMNTQQVGRPLYLPDELLGFEEGMGLLWQSGLGFGTKFFAPSYWNITQCDGRAKPNPYYQADE